MEVLNKTHDNIIFWWCGAILLLNNKLEVLFSDCHERTDSFFMCLLFNRGMSSKQKYFLTVEHTVS